MTKSFDEPVHYCNCGSPYVETECEWCHAKIVECENFLEDTICQDILVLCRACSDSIRERYISESESGYVVDYPFT